MKKITILLTLLAIMFRMQGQNDTTSVERTEIKLGKTKILVVEENGNKTTVDIVPGTDIEKLLKDMFNFTDSIIDKTLESFDESDTVEIITKEQAYDEKQYDNNYGEYTDTVEIGIGNAKMVIIHTDNKTTVRLYNKKHSQGKEILKIDENNEENDIDVAPENKTSSEEKDFDNDNDDNTKYSSPFKANWTGIELGINTLFNGKDFNMAPQYSELEINYGRSWFVNINLLQYSVELVDDHVGLVTGLGFQFRNYRFLNSNLTFADNDSLIPILDTSYKYIKSKLQTSHLRVPLFVQFDLPEKDHFHIMVGVIGDILIGSHTKQVYYTDGSKNKSVIKNHNLRFMNFFNYSLSFRIGFDSISIFAEYGMAPIFNKYRGPEVFPVNFGVNWNFFF